MRKILGYAVSSVLAALFVLSANSFAAKVDTNKVKVENPGDMKSAHCTWHSHEVKGHGKLRHCH